MSQPNNNREDTKNPALGLIRQKIAGIYNNEVKEPSAPAEIAEAEAAVNRSSHQQFMYELSTSGKSLAEIQTAWHNYYVGLPDIEKHKVWQEFYEVNDRTKKSPTTADSAALQSIPQRHVRQGATPRTHHAKPTNKQHLKSLFFGLSMGSVVVLVLLFGFFNERFIAPFLSPSRSVSSTPIIIDPSAAAAGPQPKLIIPKINVELPVVFDEKSIDEKSVQKSLESGVLHYPTTSYPGELGNGAIFGHSSNNILNSGKYKFAFVLLKRLDIGDTFMVQYNSKRYVYKVYDKKVVKPEAVSVLGDTDKPATFALITCDPPGTSLNRLVVWGEQISPDSTANVASSVKQADAAPAILPSNAQSLWQRLTKWLSS